MQGRHGGHDAAGSFYHIMSGRKCFRAGYTTKHDKAPSDILFRNVVRCEDIVSIHRGIHMHTASEKTHSRFPAGGLPDVGLVSDRQKKHRAHQAHGSAAVVLRKSFEADSSDPSRHNPQLDKRHHSHPVPVLKMDNHTSPALPVSLRRHHEDHR